MDVVPVWAWIVIVGGIIVLCAAPIVYEYRHRASLMRKMREQRERHLLEAVEWGRRVGGSLDPAERAPAKSESADEIP